MCSEMGKVKVVKYGGCSVIDDDKANLANKWEI